MFWIQGVAYHAYQDFLMEDKYYRMILVVYVANDYASEVYRTRRATRTYIKHIPGIYTPRTPGWCFNSNH